MPFDNSPGFIGTEEVGQQGDQNSPQLPQQQPLPQAMLAQEQLAGVDQPLGLQQQRQVGLGIQAVQQGGVGPEVGFTEADEDEDELLGYDDPPGLFDYEAGQLLDNSALQSAACVQHYSSRNAVLSCKGCYYIIGGLLIHNWRAVLQETF